jgi:hypothetical protein
MTVFTSVGYGNFAVSTEAGKAFVCVYAIVGFVIYGYASTVFADGLTGLSLAVATLVAKHARRATGHSCRSLQVLPVDDKTKEGAEEGVCCSGTFLLLCLAPLLLAVVLLLSAFLVEPLLGHLPLVDLLVDAIWWAFIATSTIGLGDFVPLPEWRYFVLHFIILVIGVTLFGVGVQQSLELYAGLQRSIEVKANLDALTEAEKEQAQS